MVETSVPSISICRDCALPAWGGLNNDGLSVLASSKLPAHWSFEFDGARRQRQFDRWWFHTLRLINRHLWPRYDRHQMKWEGESVVFMRPLTEADLRLSLRIQHPESGGRQFDKTITSTLRPPDNVTHKDLFEKEDKCDGSTMFSNFGEYDRQADDKLLAGVYTLCWAGDDTKQAPVIYLFKRVLQRPRPMQMALHFGIHNFGYEEATSSLTPSMCSGHCLQGLLCVGTVIERLLQDGVLTPELRRTLPQWAVDIGDRRVLAGVHYPTDSLCSWIIFLRMADFVFEKSQAKEVKELLGNAIVTKSYLYQEILRFADSADGQIYQEPLQLLKSSFEPQPIPEIDVPCAPADY